jgi:hypothetical protein
MAAYFARRAARVTAVIDEDDLEQLGRMALLESVGTYHWRCAHCMLASETEGGFVRHVERRHPDRPAIASPTILRYVHATVGRAMDHEVRRYQRRDKFHAEPPSDRQASGEYETWFDRLRWAEPVQEHVAGLALVLRAIEREGESEQGQRLRALVGKGVKRWAG